jgi:hypothetical protein
MSARTAYSTRARTCASREPSGSAAGRAEVEKSLTARSAQLDFRPAAEPSGSLLARIRWALLVFSALALFSGCIVAPANPAIKERVTNVDPKLATPDYWMDKPAVTRVSDADFYKLWNACRDEVFARFFIIDREEYRDGLLTTVPLITKQFFEVWRRDAVTVKDISDASVGTIRRTVRFQLTRKEDGTYVAEPKVLVERFSSAERRLTAIHEFHSAFSGPRPFGDVETDAGVRLPTDYWYALGRDEPLEKDLVAAIERRLH